MAATPAIELWNDIVNKRLVIGLNDMTAFDPFANQESQSAQIRFRWYPIVPISIAVAPNYQLVPTAGLTLKMAIGPRAGAEADLAYQNVWVDSGQGYLEAVLNLNTDTMASAFTSADSVSSFFEIKMTENGNTRRVYQQAITLTSDVIDPAGASILPGAREEFLTRAQCLAMFVQWFNNAPGSVIELPAKNTPAVVRLGCNDDGSFNPNS